MCQVKNYTKVEQMFFNFSFLPLRLLVYFLINVKMFGNIWIIKTIVLVIFKTDKKRLLCQF